MSLKKNRPRNFSRSPILSAHEGRSCIYVPITQDGKVVDSHGFMLVPEDE
jgi:hypothetical protein